MQEINNFFLFSLNLLKIKIFLSIKNNEMWIFSFKIIIKEKYIIEKYKYIVINKI